MALLVTGFFLAFQTAAQITNATPDTSVRASDDPNQVVCLRMIRTGSRLDSRRVCRTRKEWAELRADQRNFVDRIQQPAGSCIIGSGSEGGGGTCGQNGTRLNRN